MKPGPEMDVLVAEKVMGWRRVPSRPGRWTVPGAPPEANYPSAVPPFSTSPLDAFEVVEKLRGEGLRPIIMPDWGRQWQVVIYRGARLIEQGPFCDTMPEAVCKAALMLRKVEAHDEG